MTMASAADTLEIQRATAKEGLGKGLAPIKS